MIIPKIIHYCWFGRGKKSQQMLLCIESWKRHLPDYEIKEWNEDNFDVNQHPWMKKTIEEKNYGFSSDYFRYKTLSEYGGIYLDTDVLVKKSFDEFLNNECFFGYMNDAALATAVIGAIPHHPTIEGILKLFDTNEASDVNPSNIWVTQFFLDHYKDFVLLGKNQVLQNGIHIYEKEYFDRPTNKKHMGYAIHYYNGFWYNRKDKWHRKLIKKILGEANSAKISWQASLKMAYHYPVYLEFKKKRSK